MVSFVVDTTAPSITILTPTGGSYNNTGMVDLSWSASDATSGVAYYEVDVYNGAWTNYTDISVTGLLLDLKDGACSVDVKAFDNAGNENSATVSFIVDTVAPSINVTSPDDGAWLNATCMNVTWTGSDGGSGIAYYLVNLNGTQVANTTSEYLVLTDLKAGWYNVTVRAYDNAGNMNESYKLFSIELSSPSLNIVDPIESELFASTSVDASWSSNPPSGVLHYWVSVDGGQWVQETGTEK